MKKGDIEHIWLLIILALILLCIWFFIPDHSKEYGKHMCVDIYGKNEDCK